MSELKAVDNGIDVGAFLSNPFGESYLYSVNRGLFANTASRTVLDGHFKSVLFRQDTLYVVVGTDSGLLLDYVKRHDPVPGTRWVFVELPEVLAALEAQRGDLSSGRKDVVVCTAQDWERITANFDQTSYLFMNAVQVLKSFAVLDAFIPAYSLLAQHIGDTVDQMKWQILAGLGQAVFVEHQLANLAENRVPAAALCGKFAGETAVLLAGGPSLDDILPWVKANRGRLYVLAISRVCGRLKEEGLSPDMIFAIDPNPANVEVSKDIYAFEDEALFVHAYHVRAPIIHQWAGRSVYLGALFPWESPLNRINIQVTSPTVTNSALTCAVEFGFERVIFAGLDLCYSEHGYTHAQGSAEYEAGPALAERTVLVPTNVGRLAETNHAYKNGIEVIAAQAEYAAERGCALINPAPDAARIAGVAYQPLDTIALRPSTTDRSRHMAELPELETSRELRLRHGIAVLGELLRVDQEIRAIEDLAEEALEANRKLYDRHGKMRHFKHKRRMDHIEQLLDSKHKVLSRFVKTYGILHFVKVMRPEGKEWSDDEIRTWADEYYGAYRKAAQDAVQLLESAGLRIENRLTEDLPDPDPLRLAAQWQKDLAPRRYRVFEKRRPEAFREAFAGYQPLLHRLQEAATVLSTLKGLVYSKKQDFQDPHQLLAKVRTLFARKDLRALERLERGLAEIRTEDHAGLSRIVAGHVAELKGDTGAALEAYQEITEGRYLEDALVRMSSLLLGMGDYDNAQVALECLSHLSPTYIPQYAELLRLTGNPHQAMDEYAKYFNFVPNDVKNLLRLAQLYRDAGSPEGVELISRHILEIDPDNEAATALLDSAARN